MMIDGEVDKMTDLKCILKNEEYTLIILTTKGSTGEARCRYIGSYIGCDILLVLLLDKQICKG